MNIQKVPVDPVLATFFNELDRQGLSLQYVAQKSGIALGTLYKWRKTANGERGGTKRPQHLTVQFALQCVGIRIQLVRADGTIVRSASPLRLVA
jgi:hypothetical protein